MVSQEEESTLSSKSSLKEMSWYYKLSKGTVQPQSKNRMKHSNHNMTRQSCPKC